MEQLSHATDFQRSCERICRTLLAAAGVKEPDFKPKRTKDWDYYFGEYALGEHRLLIYIYPDEAEFAVDNMWSRFERPDYGSEQQLLGDFRSRLENALTHASGASGHL